MTDDPVPTETTSASEDPDVAVVGHDESLGVEYVVVASDEVVLRLPIGPHLHQPYGIVHGGVWCSVVETAASIGASTWQSAHGNGGNVVGVSNHTDFLRAVRDGVVEVRGTPIHRGRTQQLWLVEITDDQGRLVARGQVRLQNLATADTLGRS
jgi:1,4-dihydroxy-2-naphthoyl-CoA hydrolase